MNFFNIALDIFSYVFLKTDPNILTMVASALYMVGLWGVFKKCGVKGWWILVPFAREYKLAQCANREPEGRVFVVTAVLNAVIDILTVFIVDIESAIGTVILVIDVIVYIIDTIYSIRVYLGLIEAFGKKKI